ncbi:MAG: CoA-binding protein [Candidatus Thorarchaeota archaeon]|jgi:acyl-CoA synthetase (NDP forming)
MTRTTRPSISEMLEIQSVAIVGASANMGYYWAHCMLQWDHDLRVWLVSRKTGEALGQKIYGSLSELPEKIDYVIVAVPWKYVPQVIKECEEHGAKGVTIFTSGYSELGTEEGHRREEELAELVKNLNIRALGPNCMGLMYPKLGISFIPTVGKRAGNVGFLSQSGGVAITTYTTGVESGVGFSKLFSFGNHVDITPAEIMRFFADDDETEVVGVYVEGTKGGKEFFNALIDLAKKKPVVALKGGRSNEGSRAASSHTGALAGNREIWEAAFRQANVTTVSTLEELVATLSIFSLTPKPRSQNIGMIAISGGTSVIYTDLCVESGLAVPKTSPEIIEQLDPLIRDVGTGLGNPIDLASDYYQDQTISEVIRLVGSDPNFDSIIVEADVHNIHQVSTIMDAADVVHYFWSALADASRKVVLEEKKPVLITIPEVAYPNARMEAWRIFVERGLPVFRNMGEAVGALSAVAKYYEIQNKRGMR